VDQPLITAKIYNRSIEHYQKTKAKAIASTINHDGFQCGYCTSGQICFAVALLDEIAAGEASIVTANIIDLDTPIELTDAEIKERMSGNLCRCGAYPGIVAAVKEVYQQG
jgi:xanthine dehydrogenase YagT iron-sulfur-binding subunit